MANGSLARCAAFQCNSRQLLVSVIERLEPRHLFSAGGGFVGAGLLGQYFNNRSLSGAPAFTRTDVRVDANWNGGSPAGSTAPGFSSIAGTNWSAKWTGSIIPRYSESYRFTTISDDGVRLVVDGKALINDWTDHAAATDNGSIQLVAGHAYTIELDYYQAGGNSELHLLWSSASTPQEVIEPATPIGINGGTAADYDNSLMFADAVKMSRGWTNLYDPWGNTITASPTDWPTTDAALPLFDAANRKGTYALAFNGIATLAAGGSYDGVTISHQHYDRATNTTTAAITLATDGVAGSNQTSVALLFTDTQRTADSAIGTGITNVTLMRPTTDGSATPLPAGTLFTPDYEALLSNFSTIRFMDYLHTNGNTITTWADRTLPADVTQNQSNGGALEYAVELANETGKDLWINIPFGADDQYVSNVADLLKYGSNGVNPYTSVQAHPIYAPLNSGLKVYVEYSNENWNFNPAQAQAAALAAVGGPGGGAEGDPINYDGIYPASDGGGWLLAQRWVAERAMQISNDFRSVYGDSAMPGTSDDATVRPLFEWQYGGNWGQIGLDFLNNYYNNADGVQHVADPNPVNYFFWGGGAAWYSNTNNDNAGTIDAIYNSGLALSNTVLADVRLAAQFGLQDVGYEGGFKVGNDPPTDLQIQATVDPRAQQMTGDTVNAFFAAGGTLPVVYSASGAAHYNYSVEQDASGATNIFDQNTPRMQAYVQAEQSLPTPATNGYTLPADTGASLVINEGNIFSVNGSADVASYLLNAGAAGTYTVTIQGTADSSATTQHLMLNGADLGSVALPLWSAVPDVGTSSVLTFTVDAAGIYGLSVYDDGPTRIHYFGNVTITRSPEPATITENVPDLSALVDVAAGGTVSASAENGPRETAAKAFDQLNSTKWLAFPGTGWLQYQFAGGVTQAVAQYGITSASDDYGRDPASWEVLGSNDGMHWTLVDSRSGETFSGRGATNLYTIAAPQNFNYYRLNITGNDGANIVQLAEWSLNADPAAAATVVNPPPSPLTRLTGGKAFASSEHGPFEIASQAFDGNAATKWLGLSNTGFLAYRTDSSNVVTQYAITSANDVPSRDPKNWRLIASNDGVHWTILDVRKDQTFSSRFETINYSISNATAYKYYALKVTANGGANCIQLAELSLYTRGPDAAPAGPNILTGGFASASDQNGAAEGAAQAFDQTNITKWLAFSPTAWLQYAAPAGQSYVVTQYALTSAYDDYGRDPTDWQLLASNDGITWTPLDTQSGQTFDDRLSTHTYTLNNSTPYRFYRLNITANAGGTDTQLADLNLFGSSVSA